MLCKVCDTETKNGSYLCLKCKDSYRWCSKCQCCYTHDKFPPSLVGHLCRECKKNIEQDRRKRKAGKCIECDKQLSKPSSTRCVSCSAKKNLDQYNSSYVPKGHITKHGYKSIYEYRPGDDKKTKILEHRWRMEIHLGRKLKENETVHHKNGDRLENSIDNLELWCSNHCSGTRVKDKIVHAIDFLLQYFDEIDIDQLTLIESRINERQKRN